MYPAGWTGRDRAADCRLKPRRYNPCLRFCHRANTKISAVDGGVCDFSTANVLTDYVPYKGKLTITDSAGKKLSATSRRRELARRWALMY